MLCWWYKLSNLQLWMLKSVPVLLRKLMPSLCVTTISVTRTKPWGKCVSSPIFFVAVYVGSSCCFFSVFIVQELLVIITIATTPGFEAGPFKNVPALEKTRPDQNIKYQLGLNLVHFSSKWVLLWCNHIMCNIINKQEFVVLIQNGKLMLKWNVPTHLPKYLDGLWMENI